MLSTSLGLLASGILAEQLPVELQSLVVDSGCSIDGNCMRQQAPSQHKQQTDTNVTSTQRDGIKKSSKETDSLEDDEEEDALLQLLNDKMVPEAKTCGVWLAPSTIPGAGLGMFAGRDFARNDVVTQGDIVIPLSEIDWHNGFNLNFFLWEEYTWSHNSFPHMTEENGYQSGLQGCSPGIGAAINCDLPLVNVIDSWTKIGSDLHRKSSPGAGASTPYHDRKSLATRSIVAGEELYIDYGENYFETRDYIYGLMPMRRHYREADKLVKRYQRFRDSKLAEIPEELRDGVEKDLWDLMTSWPFETRMMNALPEKHNEIDDIMDLGGTQWRNYRRSIRKLEWLEKNGQCMDNIKPGKSKIPNAGRGAFASRFIPKGDLVSPAPLIHIKDKQELVMYDVAPEGEDGLVRRNASRPIHHQLLLNYVFGHQNSTVLLSPYGMLSSLINHSREKANTRIQWTNMTMRNPEWLAMHPDRWTSNKHSGLQFDFVALRDIQANEEILIDYGPEWEAAWKEHVRTWKKPPLADEYTAAYDLQRDLDGELPTEYYDKGIGEHINVFCHEHFRLLSGLQPSEEDYHRCRPAFKWKTAQGETRYLVELYYLYDDGNQTFLIVSDILFDVPRSVFHFEDAPYTRDHQMPFSFRHEMMIPDDIFPKSWMNKIPSGRLRVAANQS